MTPSLPTKWYNTENIHLCTINDFLSLCDEINIKIIKSVALDKNGAQLNFANRIRSVNLIGEQAIFLLKKIMTKFEIHQFICRTDNYGVLVSDADTGLTMSVDAPDASKN